MTTAAAGPRWEEPIAAVPRVAGRSRRRIVLWISLAVGVAFAVLIACLATVGTTGSHSSLVGKPAPGLAGTSLSGGKAVSLTQFSGKWVLVNFAASWCIPCRQEMPQLLKFAQGSARYNAVILTVAEDPGDAANLRAYLASERADWPAIDAPTADVPWGVQTIPTSYIVDPQGLVVAFLPAGVNAAGVDRAIAKASAAEAS
ncbi:MAG TPA: TlpA disulfide reductase family protein [Acidimicrobiales bacterium]|jgi:cytochrome c biogenesis protein CcmG/thiol:disulfide interchange protein DsbE